MKPLNHHALVGDTVRVHLPGQPPYEAVVTGLSLHPGTRTRGVWLGRDAIEPIPLDACTLVHALPQLPRNTYAGQAEHLARLLAKGTADRATDHARGWDVPFWPSRPEKSLEAVPAWTTAGALRARHTPVTDPALLTALDEAAAMRNGTGEEPIAPDADGWWPIVGTRTALPPVAMGTRHKEWTYDEALAAGIAYWRTTGRLPGTYDCDRVRSLPSAKVIRRLYHGMRQYRNALRAACPQQEQP